jgi:hypothetical protein
MVMSVLSSEHGRPRGTTYRIAYGGVLERDTLVLQQRADLGHLQGRSVVQVVGEHEDYVRLVRGTFRLFFLSGPADPRAAGDEKGCQARQEYV